MSETERERERLVSSVTNCGEISPLWQNQNFWSAQISIWEKVLNIFRVVVMLLGNFPLL